MPKTKTQATKQSHFGREDIEPALSELNRRMKDAENNPYEGEKRQKQYDRSCEFTIKDRDISTHY